MKWIVILVIAALAGCSTKPRVWSGADNSSYRMQQMQLEIDELRRTQQLQEFRNTHRSIY